MIAVAHVNRQVVCAGGGVNDRYLWDANISGGGQNPDLGVGTPDPPLRERKRRRLDALNLRETRRARIALKLPRVCWLYVISVAYGLH